MYIIYDGQGDTFVVQDQMGMTITQGLVYHSTLLWLPPVF